MDDTTNVSFRQRVLIALAAAVVVGLTMLRPTADVGAHLDGVNEVPVGPTVLSGTAQGAGG